MFTEEIKFPDGFTWNSRKCLKQSNINLVLSENPRRNIFQLIDLIGKEN